MRVGIVCPYAWDVPGGVQTHVRDLATALQGRGHEVSVLTPATTTTVLPPHVVPTGRAVPVRYNGSVARLSFGPTTAARVRRWLADGRFDLLHVHEPTAPSLSLLACRAAVAREAATGDGPPVVATFHTANPRSRALLLAAPLLRAALATTRARLAVSEAARTTLVTHLGGDAVVVPNGVVVDRYRRAAGAHRWGGGQGECDGEGHGEGYGEGHGAGQGGGVLGFLGRADEPRKGLAVLVEAFRRLAPTRPGLRLVVAGPGDVRRLVHALPPDIRRRAILLGEVSEHRKVRVLHAVDVLVAPNTGGESFGLVVAEAMAAGAAVLASDLPAFRDVLASGRSGELFATGDAGALARAAGRLLDDPVRRHALGTAARVAVRRFDWNHVVDRVLDVYADVVGPASWPGAVGGARW